VSPARYIIRPGAHPYDGQTLEAETETPGSVTGRIVMTADGRLSLYRVTFLRSELDPA
jgi:hypothetical protein